MPLAERFDVLKRTCLDTAAGRTQREQEEQADADAAEWLTDAVATPADAAPSLSPRASLLWHISELRAAADRLEKWPVESHGSSGALLDLIDKIELPATDKALNDAATRYVCMSLTHRTGVLRAPSLRGTHPDVAARMKRIAERLSAHAETLSSRAPDGREQPSPPALNELVGNVGGILAAVDGEYSAMFDRLTKAVCRRTNEWDGVSQAELKRRCAPR